MSRAWMDILLVLIIAGLLLAGCVSKDAEPAAQVSDASDAPAVLSGEALFKEKCAACHSLETSTTKDKTGYGWRKTVESMIEDYGAGESPGISDAEADTIIEHLTDKY